MHKIKQYRYIRYTICTLIVSGGLFFIGFGFAQSVADQPITRYEFAELLNDLQCVDCALPPPLLTEKYTVSWLQEQQKNPNNALDDIIFPQKNSLGERKHEYFYCVASVVDQGIMSGFPRSTSPYCPGKFCGESFLTVAELLDATVRLVGSHLRTTYPIDWRAVGERAKDAPSVTLPQRRIVAEAIKRCPQAACPADNQESFDLWLRRCSRDIAQCGFQESDDFTRTNPWTPKWNVLNQAGLPLKDASLGSRFDLVHTQQLESLLSKIREIVSCDQSANNDYDGDKIRNEDDVCPYVYDHAQRDLDNDGIGDVCDDDIDGDTIKNPLGVVDAGGNIVPRLAVLSEDNCLFVKNEQQGNADKDKLGDTCDPDTPSYKSSFRALQVDASTYYGRAPLTVDFTVQQVGLQGELRRDFTDGNSMYAQAPRHTFTQAGVYMVQAVPVVGSGTINSLLSMVPIYVLPDPRFQAGLELVSKDLVTATGSITLSHILIGDIKKLTVRTATNLLTIDPKQTTTLSLPEAGVYPIELQAYNASGSRVGLSQINIDTMHHIGSQLHINSLDPEVAEEVQLTTLLGGFSEEEVNRVLWNFGDTSTGIGELVMSHSRSQPGTYIVKQTIEFRNRALPDHTNMLTVMVGRQSSGKKLHLVTDKLIKGVGESFEFTLQTEQFPLSEMQQCAWVFQPGEQLHQEPMTQEGLSVPYAFSQPGSYPVLALCQATDQQRYHAAVTVAVENTNGCLENQQLQCDMDADALKDLCDDDIDGDGIPNRLGLLTKELVGCAIDDRNIDQPLFAQYVAACAQGAPLDNCPFQPNPEQEDADKDGRGDVCDPDPDSPDDGGGDQTTGGVAAGGATAGGGGDGNGDADGDGVPDANDACVNTPESANGQQDADGCPEAPQDEGSDPDVPDNPLVSVENCTQCPCPAADYGSSLWKGDRVRAMLLDAGGSIIYTYTKPEVIEEDIPDQLLGK